jgi:hypothetical protein
METKSDHPAKPISVDGEELGHEKVGQLIQYFAGKSRSVVFISSKIAYIRHDISSSFLSCIPLEAREIIYEELFQTVRIDLDVSEDEATREATTIISTSWRHEYVAWATYSMF